MLALLAATLLTAVDVSTGGAPPYTFRIELQTGVDPALGRASLSGVYGPVEWLSLGAGIGVGDRFPNVGLFARWHVVRVGALKLGPAVAATRGARRRINEGGLSDRITYTWEPAYRLDLGIGAEARRGRLSARLEGGAGYLLGEPECLYVGGASAADTCGSPFIPPQFRDVPASAQRPLYLALTIGVDLQPSLAGAPPGGESARARWYGGWAIPADVAAAALIGLGIASEQTGLAAAGGAAYLLGGPINHLAHHQRRKAGASVGLRLAGGVATLLALAAAAGCADGGGSCYVEVALLPVGPLVAMIVDDVVIARAPPAP
jgi:hypothetical protein